MNDPKEAVASTLKVSLTRPWFTDEEPKLAAEVVASEWLIFGPRVAEFERRFAEMVGTKHAIAVNSGSSALLVALQAAGVGRDDEVISPNMTFISTATSCMYLGGKPVLADIDLDQYYNIKVDDIEKRITPRTKAIVPVHYAGHTANMDEIMDIAERHGLFVLEDAAEAHLATYRGGALSGALGHAAIFSFTPSKPMTTGEGGMITTNDDEIAEKCRLIRNFGDPTRFQWDYLGFNFRMPEVMGAIGMAQLDKLPETIRRRHAVAKAYTEAFADISDLLYFPQSRHPSDINFQLYTTRLNLDALTISRDEYIDLMMERGVSTRLYYPCLHRQKVFAGLVKNDDAEYPDTVAYAASAVSLPISAVLTQEEQSLVIEATRDVLTKHRR